jgi:hypothetical protein
MAAWIIDGGIASKLALKMKIQMMCENAGRARPSWVLSSPSCAVIR